MILRVDHNILLLHVVSTKVQGKLENPKWPHMRAVGAGWEFGWGQEASSLHLFPVGLPHMGPWAFSQLGV